MTPGACVGSGYCCKKAPCGFAAEKWAYNLGHYWGEGKPGCPDLVWDEKAQRHWCRLVLTATGEQKERVSEALAIGAGCCSSLFNTDREKILARLRSSSPSSTASSATPPGTP